MIVIEGRPTELAVRQAGSPTAPKLCVTATPPPEALLERRRLRSIVDRLLGILAGRVFVAHNARFDWGFVSAEVLRARDLALDGPRLCTVRLARRLLPHLPSRSLDSLSMYFGLENPARHRAAGDAYVTA